MRSIVLEDNSNSLRYWICTLIISTYRMNKTGFDCVLLRAILCCPFPDSPLPLAPFPLLLFSILPRLLAHFFSLCFFLYPIRSQTTYLSHSSRLPVSLLHHEIQLRIIPPKVIFILLDYLAFPKICITIYLFMCLTHVARRTKTCIAFVGPWWIKAGEDDLFISPKRFGLSWTVIPSSIYVFHEFF